MLFDAIIVGSGIGGLSCSAALALKGKRVLLLESHKRPGGCLHTFRRKDYTFDVGMHYVNDSQEGGALNKAVNMLSAEPVHFDRLDKTFDVIYIKHGSRLATYSSQYPTEQYFRHLRKQFPHDASAVDEYQRRMLQALSPDAKDKSSTWDVAVQVTSNPDLRVALTYLFPLVGCAPSEVPFEKYASLLKAFSSNGGFYPRGGSQSVTEGLVKTIKNKGGVVMCSTKVKQILLNAQNDKNEVCGVETEKGDKFMSKIVVSDVGIQNTFMKLLPQDVSQKMSCYERVTRAETSLKLFSLFLGFDKGPKQLQLPNHNIGYFESADIESNNKRFMSQTHPNLSRVPIPFVFASIPSTRDTSKRNGNQSIIEMMCPVNYKWWQQWEGTKVGQRPDAYYDLKRQFQKHCMEKLHEMLPQLKNIKPDVAVSGSPLTTAHYINSVQGQNYGVKYRPTNKQWIHMKTEIEGLYLVGADLFGDGVHPSLMSGIVVANMIR